MKAVCLIFLLLSGVCQAQNKGLAFLTPIEKKVLLKIFETQAFMVSASEAVHQTRRYLASNDSLPCPPASVILLRENFKELFIKVDSVLSAINALEISGIHEEHKRLLKAEVQYPVLIVLKSCGTKLSSATAMIVERK